MNESLDELTEKAFKTATEALDLCLGEIAAKDVDSMFYVLCRTNLSMFQDQPQITAAVMSVAMMRLAKLEVQA